MGNGVYLSQHQSGNDAIAALAPTQDRQKFTLLFYNFGNGNESKSLSWELEGQTGPPEKSLRNFKGSLLGLVG